MKVFAILISLLLLTGTCFTTARLTTQDATKSLSIINKERARFKLPKVKYNYTMQCELESTVEPSYWFNKTLNMTHQFYLGNQLRIRPYNLYFHNATAPFKYLFHDTVESEMWRIMNYRAKQRTYFKKNKCSIKSFQMYYSCGAKQSQVADSVPGSWWFHYYPRMVLKSLKQIACILPDITGPNVPPKLRGKQKKVFICFGDHRGGDLITDNPLSN